MWTRHSAHFLRNVLTLLRLNIEFLHQLSDKKFWEYRSLIYLNAFFFTKFNLLLSISCFSLLDLTTLFAYMTRFLFKNNNFHRKKNKHLETQFREEVAPFPVIHANLIWELWVFLLPRSSSLTLIFPKKIRLRVASKYFGVGGYCSCCLSLYDFGTGKRTCSTLSLKFPVRVSFSSPSSTTFSKLI